MYVYIVTYRFYPCCRICLGFLGGHWTESIIMISQPIVFFTRFIFTFFSPVDVTTHNIQVRGRDEGQFMTAFTARSLTREELDVENVKNEPWPGRSNAAIVKTKQ